jgi:hypothetical protein
MGDINISCQQEAVSIIPTRRYVMEIVSDGYGYPCADYNVKTFNKIYSEVVDASLKAKEIISEYRIGLIAKRHINGHARSQNG